MLTITAARFSAPFIYQMGSAQILDLGPRTASFLSGSRGLTRPRLLSTSMTVNARAFDRSSLERPRVDTKRYNRNPHHLSSHGYRRPPRGARRKRLPVWQSRLCSPRASQDRLCWALALARLSIVSKPYLRLSSLTSLRALSKIVQ